MMGFDLRAARAAWSVFLVVLLLYVVHRAWQAILIFILAVFFSYMIYPVVHFLDQRTPPRIPRVASIGLVFVVIVGIMAGIIATVGPMIVDQSVKFTERLPAMAKNPPAILSKPWPAGLDKYRDQVVQRVREQAEASADQVLPAIQRASKQVLEVAGNLIYVVLIPILSFMFLKDGPDIRDTILFWFGSGPNRALWEGIFDDLDFLLAKYMRAILLLSLATFITYFAFFQFTGVPYAIVLALLGAVLEFIPLVGPLVTVAVVLLVGLLTGYDHMLWLVIFFACYRLFQDYVLSPHLMSEGVELHPLLVIFGILAGDQIAGVFGMFLSIPVLATLRIVAIRLRKATALRPAPAATTS